MILVPPKKRNKQTKELQEKSKLLHFDCVIDLHRWYDQPFWELQLRNVDFFQRKRRPLSGSALGAKNAHIVLTARLPVCGRVATCAHLNPNMEHSQKVLIRVCCATCLVNLTCCGLLPLAVVLLTQLHELPLVWLVVLHHDTMRVCWHVVCTTHVLFCFISLYLAAVFSKRC